MAASLATWLAACTDAQRPGTARAQREVGSTAAQQQARQARQARQKRPPLRATATRCRHATPRHALLGDCAGGCPPVNRGSSAPPTHLLDLCGEGRVKDEAGVDDGWRVGPAQEAVDREARRVVELELGLRACSKSSRKGGSGQGCDRATLAVGGWEVRRWHHSVAGQRGWVWGGGELGECWPSMSSNRGCP